ncbi:matrixin family metalloprotease [Nocardioides sp.]|uniref:matrixin family metalloprotease n=1 Tax=Nocardioides sp. TaxID=35761 RepID=UPI0025D9799F|nr:matrixin family metalloprotease [Nocardioides sp.]
MFWRSAATRRAQTWAQRWSHRRAQRRHDREIRGLLLDLERLERSGRRTGQRSRPAPVTGPRLRTHTSLLLALVLTALLVAFNPTSSGERLRAMLGLGQDLTFTITDTGGEGYSFAMLQPDGLGPVTWDGCREIAYVVNPAGAPAGHLAQVATAVDDLERASGLRFRYAGTTADRTFEDRARPFGSAPPVLVAWATPEEVPELAGDVAGVGGAEARSVAPGTLTYVTGMVALDRDGYAAIGAQPGGSELQLAILEHELAHVLGLGHVSDPAQLMYAETTGQRHLAAGDLAGLAVLGSGPCR